MGNKIIAIKNVRGYLEDSNKIAYLNTEDVARGLGFTENKNGIEYIFWYKFRHFIFATCCERKFFKVIF